jgi:hypothetical protein
MVISSCPVDRDLVVQQGDGLGRGGVGQVILGGCEIEGLNRRRACEVPRGLQQLLCLQTMEPARFELAEAFSGRRGY